MFFMVQQFLKRFGTKQSTASKEDEDQGPPAFVPFKVKVKRKKTHESLHKNWVQINLYFKKSLLMKINQKSKRRLEKILKNLMKVKRINQRRITQKHVISLIRSLKLKR